MINDNCAF